MPDPKRRRATIQAIEIIPPEDLEVGHRRSFKGELVVDSERSAPDGTVRFILRIVDIALGKSPA